MFDASAILLEKYGVRFDAEEGRWVTTEKDHKIHINSKGVPDKGNPYVIAVMKGEDPKTVKSKSAQADRSTQIKTIRRANNRLGKILREHEEAQEKQRQREMRLDELEMWIDTSENLRNQYQATLDRLKGQEDSTEYKEALEKREKYEDILRESKEERDALLKEQESYDDHAYIDKYEKAAKERDEAVLAAFPSAKDCTTTEEVEDYLKARGYFSNPMYPAVRNDRRIDLLQMSDENSRALAEHLDALADDYPWVVGEMGGVSCLREGGFGTWAFTDGYSAVTFNSDYWGKYGDSIEKSFQKTCESDFHPPGLTSQSVIDHEFTHVMEQIINGHPTFEHDERYADYETASDYVMAKVAERMGVGTSQKERQEIRRAVSRYSADNQGIKQGEDGSVWTDDSYGANTEFLAEAIAEARCSAQPRKISLMVLEEFNKLIDDLGFERKRNDGRQDAADL